MSCNFVVIIRRGTWPSMSCCVGVLIRTRTWSTKSCCVGVILNKETWHVMIRCIGVLTRTKIWPYMNFLCSYHYKNTIRSFMSGCFGVNAKPRTLPAMGCHSCPASL